MPDPRDFTGRYNTPLPSNVEQQFQAWLIDESKRQGRNVGSDLYDYDLRGLWNSGGGFGGENGHATDQWKKPNHPTFSNQSRYNGVDGFQGGAWADDNGLSFTPGPTNMYSGNELQEYFRRAEPDVRLVLRNILEGMK